MGQISTGFTARETGVRRITTPDATQSVPAVNALGPLGAGIKSAATAGARLFNQLKGESKTRELFSLMTRAKTSMIEARNRLEQDRGVNPESMNESFGVALNRIRTQLAESAGSPEILDQFEERFALEAAAQTGEVIRGSIRKSRQLTSAMVEGAIENAADQSDLAVMNNIVEKADITTPDRLRLNIALNQASKRMSVSQVEAAYNAAFLHADLDAADAALNSKDARFMDPTRKASLRQQVAKSRADGVVEAVRDLSRGVPRDVSNLTGRSLDRAYDSLATVLGETGAVQTLVANGSVVPDAYIAKLKAATSRENLDIGRFLQLSDALPAQRARTLSRTSLIGRVAFEAAEGATDRERQEVVRTLQRPEAIDLLAVAHRLIKDGRIFTTKSLGAVVGRAIGGNGVVQPAQALRFRSLAMFHAVRMLASGTNTDLADGDNPGVAAAEAAATARLLSESSLVSVDPGFLGFDNAYLTPLVPAFGTGLEPNQAAIKTFENRLAAANGTLKDQVSDAFQYAPGSLLVLDAERIAVPAISSRGLGTLAYTIYNTRTQKAENHIINGAAEFESLRSRQTDIPQLPSDSLRRTADDGDASFVDVHGDAGLAQIQAIVNGRILRDYRTAIDPDNPDFIALANSIYEQLRVELGWTRWLPSAVEPGQSRRTPETKPSLR